MNFKSAKPQTQLTLDIVLFTIYLSVVCSALMAHTATPRNSHVRFMLHAIHELSGIAMSAIIGIHLALHLPWIRSQLRKIFNGGQPSRATSTGAQATNE